MRQALELALEALEGWGKGFPDNWGDLDTEAITAIKEALAQPEQEPVAWACKNMIVEFWTTDEYQAKRKAEQGYQVSPLYTTPPQRKPLTEDEITALDEWLFDQPLWRVVMLVRAIEAAHNIKE